MNNQMATKWFEWKSFSFFLYSKLSFAYMLIHAHDISINTFRKCTHRIWRRITERIKFNINSITIFIQCTRRMQWNIFSIDLFYVWFNSICLVTISITWNQSISISMQKHLTFYILPFTLTFIYLKKMDILRCRVKKNPFGCNLSKCGFSIVENHIINFRRRKKQTNHFSLFIPLLLIQI